MYVCIAKKVFHHIHINHAKCVSNIIIFQKIFTAFSNSFSLPLIRIGVVSLKTSIGFGWLSGFDGGQSQNFILEVYDQQTGILQANLSSPVSHFIVNGLRAGRSLLMAVYAANTRGRSESASLEGFTLKKAEKQTGKYF